MRTSTEPRHHIHGLGFGARLLRQTKLVVFTNAELSIHENGKQHVSQIGFTQWFRRFWQAATVFGYPSPGCLLLGFARLFRPSAQRILVIFSGPSPDGSAMRHWWRVLAYRIGVWGATDVVAISTAAMVFVKHANASCRVWTSPVTVDMDFFCSIGSDASAEQMELPDKFYLVVGDYTRDDSFIYQALQGEPIPILRISRDPSIAQLVATIQKSSRGDRILSKVSFGLLARLYREAAVSIFVSRFDGWQPAGATSLSECLGCGGIAIAEGGGVIEADFGNLAKDAVGCPIRFFPRRNAAEFVRMVREMGCIDELERLKWREQSRIFASRYLDIEHSFKVFESVLEAKGAQEQ